MNFVLSVCYSLSLGRPFMFSGRYCFTGTSCLSNHIRNINGRTNSNESFKPVTAPFKCSIMSVHLSAFLEFWQDTSRPFLLLQVISRVVGLGASTLLKMVTAPCRGIVTCLRFSLNSVLLFSKNIIIIIILPVLCGMRNFSSLTREGTRVPRIGSTES